MSATGRPDGAPREPAAAPDATRDPTDRTGWATGWRADAGTGEAHDVRDVRADGPHGRSDGRAVSHATSRRWLQGLAAASFVVLAWSLVPFAGVFLWAYVLAVMFVPLHRRWLARWPRRPGTVAGVVTLLVALVIVLPALAGAALLGRELATMVGSIDASIRTFGAQLDGLLARAPAWLAALLDRLGLGDLRSARETLAAQLGENAQAIGQRLMATGLGAFELGLAVLLALYLTFYFLRDGGAIARWSGSMLPVQPARRAALARRIVDGTRATVNGSVLVAAAQGVVGGVVFWLAGLPSPALWGAVMGVASLLPALGTALVWLPAGLWLLATGRTGAAVGVMLAGVFVIGLIDNLLRPMLIGRDTQLPDWLILMATLGAIALIGFNGLVVGPLLVVVAAALADEVRGQRPP